MHSVAHDSNTLFQVDYWEEEKNNLSNLSQMCTIVHILWSQIVETTLGLFKKMHIHDYT